jgi:hypothetical protein
MFEWFYTRNKEPQGPVDSRRLKQLATAGELLPTDFVWKEDMPEWVPASVLKSLFDPNSTTDVVPPPPPPPSSPSVPAENADAPAPAPAAETIRYYSPSTELPPEVVAALKGFPPLHGARDAWPLTADQQQQIVHTAVLRRPIRRAAAAYHVLAIIGATIGALYLILFVQFSQQVSSIAFNRQTGLPLDFVRATLTAILVILGLSVLCFLAGRATHRCQRWAPITMIVHFSLWILYLLYDFVRSYQQMGGTVPILVLVFLIGLVPPAVFLVMSINALTHLRPFLRRPVWTVHLLISAKA